MKENISQTNITEELGKLHPQLAAVLLFSLPPDITGEILSSIPLGLAFELTERILETAEFDDNVFTGIRSRLENLYPDFERLAGDKSNLLSSALEYTVYMRRREIIFHLAEENSTFLPLKNLRIMEDILTVEDQKLESIIASIGTDEIKRILRIAADELKKKILRCFPEKTAEEIKSDLEWGGAVPVADIAESCQRAVDFINSRLSND